MNNFGISDLRLTAVVFLTGMVSCTGQSGSRYNGTATGFDSGKDAAGQAVLLFDTLVHDFGTILEGEKVVCYFDYVNSGSADLILSSVTSTCGCTTPDWSGEPLKPGGQETLKVIFDSSGRSGLQIKSVNVRSNSENQHVLLTIKADIVGNP